MPFSAARLTAYYAIGRPDLASRGCTVRGGVARVHVPGFGAGVVTSDPALVKQTLTARPDVLHSGETSPLAVMLGKNSLFALDEEPHLRERRLILPPFHGKRLGAYVQTFEEETLAEIATWPVGREFATLDSMMRITLNAILRTVFGAEGEKLAELREILPPLVKLGSMLSSVYVLRRNFGGHGPWAKFLRLRARFDSVVDQLIAEHRSDPRLAERTDVLALLLQARYDDGGEMTRDQIADELLTILVAGHETTATTLAWTVERLRRHRDLLARLVAEAEQGGSKLREATIWEVQRTRPVIMTTERNVAKPFELGDWTLEPGMFIWLDILGLHRDPALFPEPLAFLPERFFEAPPETYSWLPFGGGVRRCPGAAFAKLEMDVVLRMMLTHCAIEPTAAKDERWRFRGVAFQPNKGGLMRLRSVNLSPLAHERESAAPALVS